MRWVVLSVYFSVYLVVLKNSYSVDSHIKMGVMMCWDLEEYERSK